MRSHWVHRGEDPPVYTLAIPYCWPPRSVRIFEDSSDREASLCHGLYVCGGQRGKLCRDLCGDVRSKA